MEEEKQKIFIPRRKYLNLDIVKQEDILIGCNFQNDFDYNITKDIINTIEITAGEEIDKDKIVGLPYIGKVTKHTARREIRKRILQMVKDGTRPTGISKEEYKKFVYKISIEVREAERAKQLQREREKRYIRDNRKLCDNIRAKFGLNYFNLFVTFRTKFNFVEDTQNEDNDRENDNG